MLDRRAHRRHHRLRGDSEALEHLRRRGAGAEPAQGDGSVGVALPTLGDTGLDRDGRHPIREDPSAVALRLRLEQPQEGIETTAASIPAPASCRLASSAIETSDPVATITAAGPPALADVST